MVVNFSGCVIVFGTNNPFTVLVLLKAVVDAWVDHICHSDTTSACSDHATIFTTERWLGRWY